MYSDFHNPDILRFLLTLYKLTHEFMNLTDFVDPKIKTWYGTLVSTLIRNRANFMLEHGITLSELLNHESK